MESNGPHKDRYGFPSQRTRNTDGDCFYVMTTSRKEKSKKRRISTWMKLVENMRTFRRDFSQ